MSSESDRRNIQMIREYFQAGCKEKHTGAVGMEVEHFVIKKKDQAAVSYYGPHGVGALLERISEAFPQKGRSEGQLIALGNDAYVISIEPAAQLEISIVPRTRLKDIEEIYLQFIDQIHPILEEWDQCLLTTGYHLTERSEDMELIPKKRYQFMNRYFEEIGMYGRCMMRGTASVQGSVDYYSEEDFVKTYRAAVAFSPLFALLTDNALIFQKKPWEKHMARSFIWDRVDPERCTMVPGTFDDDFGFEAYAKWVYEVPAIFAEKDGNEEYVGRTSLKDLCKEAVLSEEQLEHGLSIVFPDVRLKQYVEIRVGDSMPLEYTMSYIALLKGMFWNRDELYKLYKELEQFTPSGHMTQEDVRQGKDQLIARGYQGKIYGKPAGFWLERMFRLAGQQLEEEERTYLQPMQRLVQAGKSVRDRNE